MSRSYLIRLYSPHSPLGSLRSLSCHLPARSIAGPLWLKTVTCGLFLRCFTPPRRAPLGECISGRLVYDVIPTGVRTIVRTRRRPHGRGIKSVYAASVFPSGRLPRLRSHSCHLHPRGNALAVAWSTMSFRPERGRQSERGGDPHGRSITFVCDCFVSPFGMFTAAANRAVLVL